MCKGKPPGETTATLYAGQNVNVQFEGVARHGGVRHAEALIFMQRACVNFPSHTMTIKALLSCRRYMAAARMVQINFDASN